MFIFIRGAQNLSKSSRGLFGPERPSAPEHPTGQPACLRQGVGFRVQGSGFRV